MVREDLKAKAANTTVTAYKVGLSKESKTAAVVTMKPAAGQDAWNTIGLFYPQKAEKDEAGKSIVHNLTQGNSSFPCAVSSPAPKHQHRKSGGHQHSYRDSAYLRQPQRHQCQVVRPVGTG